MTNNRRTIQHTDSHYDIEEVRTDSDGNSVWAVIFCSEEKMNGYTQSTDLETRVNNLFAQIPQEYHLRATIECYGEDDHDFERKLTAYVLHRTWETYDHPVNEADAVSKYVGEVLANGEQDAPDVFTDGFCDPNLKAEQLTGYFGKVKVTTSKEWDKRHLYATREEQAGAKERRKAAGFKGE